MNYIAPEEKSIVGNYSSNNIYNIFTISDAYKIYASVLL